MFCPKCGKSNPNNSMFCSSCGTKIEAASAYPTPAQPVQPVQPVQPQPVNMGQQPVQPVQPQPVNMGQQPVQPVQPVQSQPVNMGQQPVQPIHPQPVNMDQPPVQPISFGAKEDKKNSEDGSKDGKSKKGLIIGLCAAISVLLITCLVLVFVVIRPWEKRGSTEGAGSGITTASKDTSETGKTTADTNNHGNSGDSYAAVGDPSTDAYGNGNTGSFGTENAGNGYSENGSGYDSGSASEGITEVEEVPEVTEIPAITPDPYAFVSTRELSKKEAKRGNKIKEYTEEAEDYTGIDIFEDNYTKGSRNTGYKWDDTVFYALEGYRDKTNYTSKTRCDVKRLAFYASNGHECEIEASMNPDTGIPNKIVLIEYLDSGIEVYEFYFDNDGKISFIFDYLTDNYVSTFATTDKPGMRYLFHNDCMVTLRRITSSETVNISIGSEESNRMKNQFSSSKRKLYNDQSRDVRDNFDEEEDRWIDAAYNVYNLVMNAETKTTIIGYVYSGEGEPLPGTKVGVFTKDFEALLFETVTADDGSYRFVVPDDTYNYKLKFLSEGFLEENIYDISSGGNQVYIYQNTIYLFAEAQDAPVSLTLGDALHYNTNGSGMMPLSYAKILFRRGCNNREGDVLYSYSADGDGRFDGILPSGNYTVQIDADGFTSMFYNIVANYFHPVNKYECYATPTLNAGEYRIVLTWGERPYDLDSHLFTGSSGHVWYGNKVDSNGSNLDVDDTSSYGPETTTIVNLKKNSYYKFCVADYSNLASGYPSSTEMSYSGASVFVYNSTGLVGKFDVPYGVSGTIWEVFEIRNGNVCSIQRYYNSDTNRTWWHHQ